jgi:hypothetical protein
VDRVPGAGAQHGGGVDGRHQARAAFLVAGERQEHAPLPGDPERRPEQRLAGGGAERDDHLGADEPQ